MNLLVISNNPGRASFRQRIEVYLDALRKNGINCRIAKLPTGIWGRRKLFEQAKDFDAVFLHKKCLNLFDARRLRKCSRKIIYDFDDAVMFSDKKPDSNSISHMLPFKRTAKIADVIFAGNQYLADIAKKFNTNTHIIPTGLDTKEYLLDKSPSDNRIRLVWIGSNSTLRYLMEIKPVLEEIGSRFNNVVLRIISDEFIDLRNMPVEKRQWSKETQASDLVDCDIGLAPLPDNRFTKGKCGFKILQYAAANLAIIASPVGVNAEFVKNDVNGLLANEKQNWYKKIAYLIDRPDIRSKMCQQNLSWVRSYDKSIIATQLVGLIKKCLQETD